MTEPATLGPGEIRAAASLLRTFADDAFDEDWTGPAGDIGLTTAQTADHISDALATYATILASRAQRRLPMPRYGLPTWVSEQLVINVEVFADVLAEVVGAAPSTVRVFHPFGLADPEGMAAMGVDELLVHTWDVAQGLHREFDPPGQLVDAVLARLFPWVGAEDRSLDALLWCNGRTAYDGRPRMHRWRWWAAPVQEWDGVTIGERPPRRVGGRT